MISVKYPKIPFHLMYLEFNNPKDLERFTRHIYVL